MDKNWTFCAFRHWIAATSALLKGEMRTRVITLGTAFFYGLKKLLKSEKNLHECDLFRDCKRKNMIIHKRQGPR